MNLIKPKRLKAGGTVSIIAPSGNVDKNSVLKGKQYLESKGYTVKLGKNIFNDLRYLSGNDEDRLSDLHAAFADKDVDAIICARGGYGALRLINDIDYKLVVNNPKIFCGYSDITILNAMFLVKSGLITFSAPMLQSDFGTKETDDFTINEFFNNLTMNKIQITADKTAYNSAKNTAACGLLIGGNLSSFVSLCGTDFLPDEKFIFFAEDLNEPVYKLDRCFTQLFNIDEFRNNVQAIVLGDFLKTDEEYLSPLYEDIENKYNIPVLDGFPFSHSHKKTTVPYGAYAKLCGNKLTISDYLS